MRRRAMAAALLAMGGALVAATSGSRAAGPHSFPHAAHLSVAAVEAGLAVAAGGAAASPGVDAECRVCHDHALGPEQHLEFCAACHQDDAHLAVERAPAAVTPDARRPFPHVSHLRDPALTCLSCHPMRRDADWIGFGLPGPGLSAAPGAAPGTVACADCHATHEPVGGRVPHDERTGDGRLCADCHQGAQSIVPRRHRSGVAANRAGPRLFLHADHGGAAAACEDCHAGVRESRTIWDYESTADTVARCNDCHVADAAGTALARLVIPERTKEAPRIAFERFSHASHLAPAGDIETTGEVTAGCRTCHFPATDPRSAALFPAARGDTEPAGRAALLGYRSCVPCHASWAVAQHGGEAGIGWSCFRCHAPEADAEGRLAPLRATVVRDDLDAVTFGLHAHPGVTTSGAELADPSQPDGKTCEDCHVAQRETLLSRIDGRVFDHASHVADDAPAAACAGCHPDATEASRSDALTRFDPRTVSTDEEGEARGCLDCHVGARREDLAPRRVERVVIEFDHGAHTGAATLPGGSPGIACTTCHERGGESGFHVPADIADCTRCHSHDASKAEAFARTGTAVSPLEAAACVHCHGAPQGGTGPAPVVRAGTGIELALGSGTQWHDKSGDCAVCHERDGLAGQPARYRERIRSARVIAGIHTDPALADAWFNDPRIREPGGDPGGQGRSCLSCHRDQPPVYLEELAR